MIVPIILDSVWSLIIIVFSYIFYYLFEVFVFSLGGFSFSLGGIFLAFLFINLLFNIIFHSGGDDDE